MESPGIKKVIFHVCDDSSALFSYYNIHLDRIQDLQLIELAIRSRLKKYVIGLAKYIKRDSPISNLRKAEWERCKDEVTKYFNPYKGGNYKIFNKHPLTLEIRDYCAVDVSHLPALYNTYKRKISLMWRTKVQNTINNHVWLSQKPEYDSQASNKVLGPWTEDYSKEWYALLMKRKTTISWITYYAMNYLTT
jgi:exonuclease 3'-5' domain-containing protein 1